MNKRYETLTAVCIALVFVLITVSISWFICYDRAITNEKLLEHTQNELTSMIEDSMLKSTELDELNIKLEYTAEQLDMANKTVDDLKSIKNKLVYIGDFKLTHYCAETHEHICGEGTDLTATGSKVTVGRTVAVDPNVIPYGTRIYIEGYGWYIAEDCGSAVKNKQIDIAVETHADALLMGVKYGGVWVLADENY